jgi:DNA-binding MarR family transcriptional regulator
VSRWGDDPRDSQDRELKPNYLDYPRLPDRDVRDHETPREIGERRIYRYLEKDYRLNSAEIAVIRDIGRFRIVDVQDLGKFLYKSQQDLAKRDVRHLQNQKLIRVIHLPGNDRVKFATLTKEGRELASDTRAHIR